MYSISIHAPTRGATTAREIDFVTSFISIHAPTRGATRLHDPDWWTYRYFNPRSYKRSDDGLEVGSPEAFLFQSTLLQEERQQIESRIRSFLNFNPRSYKRSDLWTCIFRKLYSYFNPRSYKRSDRPFPDISFAPALFQSTLLQEERLLQTLLFPKNNLFQSTLLQEERHSNSAMFAIWYIFQSTLLQEERHFSCWDFVVRAKISIHAPTRGATSPAYISDPQ